MRHETRKFLEKALASDDGLTPVGHEQMDRAVTRLSDDEKQRRLFQELAVLAASDPLAVLTQTRGSLSRYGDDEWFYSCDPEGFMGYASAVGDTPADAIQRVAGKLAGIV